jgi:DNA gyrase/topoisomerase IV subunit B
MFHSSKLKLIDCTIHGIASGAELFIVEGDSASSSLMQLCDPQLQAVLPMQGKPLNAIKASVTKVLENPLLSALVDALGTGCGADFNIEKLRYQRVLLLMDPDADGIHCGALMLMFFHRYMPELLRNGHIHMMRPPVGEVINTATGEVTYGFIEPEFIALCETGRKNNPTSFNAMRYRGLAGIDASKLSYFCVNPNTRRSTVMRLEDAQMAIDVFSGTPT